MTVLYEGEYEFVGYHGSHAKCLAFVARYPEYDYIRVTDIGEGTSVTNMAESLATELVQRYGLRSHPLVWMEHYPVRGLERDPMPATWDLVAFDWKGNVATHPKWRRVEEEHAKALERGEVRGVGQGSIPGVVHPRVS